MSSAFIYLYFNFEKIARMKTETFLSQIFYLENNQWLNLQKVNTHLLSSALPEIPVKEESDNPAYYDEKWVRIQFNNFYISLPFRHPLYNLRPYLDIDKKKQIPIFGYLLNDHSENNYLKVIFLNTIPLKKYITSSRLFHIPFVKDYLLMIPKDKIWRDIFLKDFNTFPKLFDFNNIKRAEVENYIKEMSYFYYIWFLRNKFLPEKVISYTFDNSRNMGLVKVESEDKNFNTEWLYYFYKDNIYKIHLKQNTIYKASLNLRNKFVEELQFSESTPYIAEMILNELKTVPKFLRSSDGDFTYRFSALTHTPFNKDLIKEMINDLEINKSKLELTTPIYEYIEKAFNKDFLVETQNYVSSTKEKIEEKIKRSEKKVIVIVPTPEPTPTEQSEIERVKKNAINNDNEDDRLVH
ncbi:MAG: hypothetical protein U0T83_03610 [Bacteriovoracaceae bacterium]